MNPQKERMSEAAIKSQRIRDYLGHMVFQTDEQLTLIGSLSARDKSRFVDVMAALTSFRDLQQKAIDDLNAGNEESAKDVISIHVANSIEELNGAQMEFKKTVGWTEPLTNIHRGIIVVDLIEPAKAAQLRAKLREKLNQSRQA